MKKTIRILLGLFIFGLFVGLGTLIYVFNKPRINIAKESAAFSVDAKMLIADFQKDEQGATTKYLNKVISVKGEVKGIRTLDNHGMVFSLENGMEGVSCTVDSADVVKFRSKIDQITKGSSFKFKGRCSGMLMDIQVINCVPE